jgi:Fe2+ or Zn2+ uptake regulation protein
MSISLDQIKNNEITSLDLSDDPDIYPFDVYALLDALKENVSINTVRLDGLFLGCQQGNVRSKIVHAIARLPFLREVFLGEACLLVNDLSHIVTTARLLQSMSLHRIVFQGIQERFDSFETALYQHLALKACEITDCIAAVPTIDLERVKNAAKKHSGCNTLVRSELAKNTSTAKSA